MLRPMAIPNSYLRGQRSFKLGAVRSSALIYAESQISVIS